MRVIITAGGTGGHIYPALAIADKIKMKNPKNEVLYIGTHDRMEKDIVPARGYAYKAIKIYGFSKTQIKRDFLNIKLIRQAKKECVKIMQEFKPDVVIGVGGYVTFPVIRAANKLGIKTFIHEQNSIPGKSNRILSRVATKIGISFADSKKYFKADKCVLTGNPCSENALDIKAIPKTKFGLDRKKKSIIIVQGSLGSQTMNQKMQEFLKTIENEAYDVLYVTGKNSFEEFRKNKFSKNVHLVPYVDNMAGLIKDVDLMVTRAGASTLSEIMALKIPSIIIPSPFVANNHQLYNAMSMKNAGAAELIEEHEFNAAELKEKINLLLNDQKYYQKMQANLGKMSINNSSTIIYELLETLIKK